MAISLDPENNETRALFEMTDFRGQTVLEIGCGDGRMTWRYADVAAHVTAIDPEASEIALAKEKLSAPLQDRIDFQAVAFEDFAAACPSSTFDIVILSWSLC